MSRIDDLEKIQKYRDNGILTQEEFENEKKKILGIEDYKSSDNLIRNENIIEEFDEIQPKSNKISKKIIFVVLGIIVIVAIIGTIIFISNRKNSNVKNSNTNQITNNIQQSDIIKENTKYISTGYNVNEDIEMGFSYLYLIFNNTTFKLHFDANFGGDAYDMFIKGTYSQNGNHIVFDFSNAKIGVNENEEEVTAEYKSIVDTWSNILNNGVNISDEGKTLIAIDNTGKTITFKSNEQNSIETNNNQIKLKQNTKYVATGIEDFYKQAGITELYLVFNNGEFKFVLNINMGENKYETYIKGTYNQTENHIIFDFSNAKVGYNNGKLNETGDIIEPFMELFKDGATISNGNKTLTVAEVDGITLAFEDSGLQITNEEFNKSIENIENNSTHSSVTNSNSSTQTSTPSNNSTSSKDNNMVFIPIHSYGEQLENYTKELDKHGIKYKIIKKEDWSYQNNAVIEVDYEGATVEKGTIVTITVADNIYLDIFTDKEYMLKLADLENANKQLSVSISINGNNVYNGNLPENGEICKLTYKNKLDNNLKLSITINGKKITKEIKYRYVADDYSRPYILIREGGDVGEG